jgi:hypothetical protein
MVIADRRMFAQKLAMVAVEFVCHRENSIKFRAKKVVERQYLSYDELLSYVWRGVFASTMDLRVV